MRPTGGRSSTRPPPSHGPGQRGDTPAARHPAANARSGRCGGRSLRAAWRRAAVACGAPAHRGDTAGLETALSEAPGLLATTFAARLMRAAALAGRAETLRLLVRRGVDVNAPHWLPVAVAGRSFERVIFVTPLCAARLRHRAAAEQILLEAGARDDVFTAAFLGDSRAARLPHHRHRPCSRLRSGLGRAQHHPLDHAVAGGQAEALRLLLDHVRPPLESGVRALRGAAERGTF